MKITAKNAEPIRLDKYLAGLDMPGLNRSQLQKIIKDGLASVNGKIGKANLIVREGDKVELRDKTKTEKKAVAKAEKVRRELIADPVIIDQTADYLVINKPAGIAVHRQDENDEQYTLAEWLVDNFPQVNGVGEDPLRPGIVHRLDKDVSGLMLVTLNNDSFLYFKNLFKRRKLEKVYTALVYDKIDRPDGVINFPIIRASSGHKMAALPATDKGKDNKDGKKAITEFVVLKNYINYTLLEVKIKTGRTHQIRVHLFAYNHPIVGDDWYANRKNKEMNQKLGTDRVFLTATRLAFKDRAGKKQEYKIELPEEFNELLKKIK